MNAAEKLGKGEGCSHISSVLGDFCRVVDDMKISNHEVDIGKKGREGDGFRKSNDANDSHLP